AYDLDMLKDDLLGDAVSSADGHFEIRFTERAFAEIPGQRPDIYLRVFDASGRVELASTRREVRRHARAEERFEIRIRPRACQGPSPPGAGAPRATTRRPAPPALR